MIRKSTGPGRPMKTRASTPPVKRSRPAAPAAPKRVERITRPEASDNSEPNMRAAVPELTSARARELRAEAHALEPIVHVGHAGLNESVVRAVHRALRDHDLIKVRLHEPEDKRAMAKELAEAARAALCGLIGHTLILYRPRPKTRGPSGVARTSIKRNQRKLPRFTKTRATRTTR